MTSHTVSGSSTAAMVPTVQCRNDGVYPATMSGLLDALKQRTCRSRDGRPLGKHSASPHQGR